MPCYFEDLDLKEHVCFLNNHYLITYFKKFNSLIDDKIDSIYEEFRCELGIHERDILDAQNLHKQLFSKNPFRYESPFLISAVCVYAISHNIPQQVTIEEIERISHIKKEDIVKCYKMALNSEINSSLQRRDDDVAH